MRILLTNDDGIHAPGLGALERIARSLSDDVWIVAPETDQSGLAHSLTLSEPLRLRELGDQTFALRGTPTDCVIMAIRKVLDRKPDLVLSGVNRGNNSAENVLYSGTIGAAMEAALQGVKSIALSQFFGPKNAKLDDPYEAAVIHGAGLIQRLLDKGLWDEADYRLFYNVNFPPLPAADVKGTRVANQGFRRYTAFSLEPHLSPSGRQFLWIKGGEQGKPTLPGTDVTANVEGYISITPLRCDLTAHDLLADLEARLA